MWKQLIILGTVLVSIHCFELNEDDCGIRPIRFPKIINGTSAVHGNYPWMISLQFNNRHHCGGTLIRGNWVLTAAHCIYRANAKKFQVKLGGHYRNKLTESTSITVKPTIIIAHSGFSFATFADDLALIKLPNKVQYSNYIRPICLPKETTNVLVDKNATVIGWGKLQQGGYSAEILQEAEIPIVDNDKCIEWYREKGKMLKIRPTQICAGLEEGGRDACQGDSGSPMLVSDPNTNVSTIVGIVSAGIGCALPKLPGLYTRVGSYMPWIEQMVLMYDASIPMSSNQTSSVPEINKENQAIVVHIPTTTANSTTTSNETTTDTKNLLTSTT